MFVLINCGSSDVTYLFFLTKCSCCLKGCYRFVCLLMRGQIRSFAETAALRLWPRAKTNADGHSRHSLFGPKVIFFFFFFQLAALQKVAFSRKPLRPTTLSLLRLENPETCTHKDSFFLSNKAQQSQNITKNQMLESIPDMSAVSQSKI